MTKPWPKLAISANGAFLRVTAAIFNDVVRTTFEQDRPDEPARECTNAVLKAEERYERQTQGRAQDRIAALTMLLLARHEDKPARGTHDRHFVLAYLQGETIFDERWSLGAFMAGDDDVSRVGVDGPGSRPRARRAGR